MTEAEWLTSAGPQRLLEYLRGRASDRKLLLFACACCRRLWPLLPDERSRRLVETSERYADGRADRREVNEAWQAAEEAARAKGRKPPAAAGELLPAAWAQAEAVAAGAALATEAGAAAAWVASEAVLAVSLAAGPKGPAKARREERRQADLLRELVGNPFRPVPFDPAWLEWNGGCVFKIARRIDAERRFEDLPVLADALAEAGCTDAALVSHFRTPTGHVPGCWALDVLLGKG